MDKKSISQLQFGDFSKIAKKSGFSLSTVRKWYKDELKLPEATEQKILAASVEVMTDRTKEMEMMRAKNRVIMAKLQEFDNRLAASISAAVA